MFTINNLNKYYNRGKTNEFQVLKNINVKFPSKGFVFLLGKSGSGKSTLLNIIGGLDGFDDGVITIKDTSSDDFGKGAWDSFRNTYVGFIFQDYSIIDEYTIGKNIELVLELQGVKKSEAKRRAVELLKAVDLPDEIAKKKPNEISGGQKQRIAIARALVKNPDVILADEPTGALDSKTSEQILNILKEISANKLVIMVSHDREAAFKYADQIIEMADGEIQQNYYNESGLKYIGNTADFYKSDSEIGMVLRIPKNQKLSSDKIRDINKYLEENDATLYIPLNKKHKLSETSLNIVYTLSEKESEDMYLPIAKDVKNIHGTTNPQAKNQVNPAKATINSDRGRYEVIKSRLPIGNSIKLGFSSIWRRKFKSLFSIIIFLAAIGIFGLVETMNKFDYGKALAKSYDTAGIEQITVTNTRESSEKYEDRGPDFFTMDEYISVVNSNSELSLGRSYDFFSAYSLPGASTDSSLIVNSTEIIGSIVIQDLSSYNLELIDGVLPTSPKEILVTDYTADVLAGLQPSRNNDNDYSAWLSGADKMIFGSNVVSVVGVVETGYEEYLSLNELPVAELAIAYNKNNVNKFNNLNYSIFSRIIVTESFQTSYINGKYLTSDVTFGIPNSTGDWTMSIGNTMFNFKELYSGVNSNYLYIHDNFVNEINSVGDLSDTQIILDQYSLGSWIFEQMGFGESTYNTYNTKPIDEKLDYLVSIGFLDSEFKISGKIGINNQSWSPLTEYTIVGMASSDELTRKFLNIDQYQFMLDDSGVSNYVDVDMRDMISYYGFDSDLFNESNTHGADGKIYDQEAYSSYLVDVIEDAGGAVTAIPNDYVWTYISDLKADASIAGLVESSDYLTESDFSQYGDENGYLNNLLIVNGIDSSPANYNGWNGFFVSSNNYKNNSYFADDNMSGILVNLSDDLSVNESFFNYTQVAGISNSTNSIGFYVDTFYSVSTDLGSIFFWISFGISGFAAFLLFTNISNSVVSKTNDIGTLRAIGARGSDVSKIFIFEGLAIGLLTFVLSVITLFILTIRLNTEIQQDLGLQLSLFNVNSVIVLEMFALTIGVVLLASWLPVKRVSNMKPIDAIKSIT